MGDLQCLNRCSTLRSVQSGSAPFHRQTLFKLPGQDRTAAFIAENDQSIFSYCVSPQEGVMPLTKCVIGGHAVLEHKVGKVESGGKPPHPIVDAALFIFLDFEARFQSTALRKTGHNPRT